LCVCVGLLLWNADSCTRTLSVVSVVTLNIRRLNTLLQTLPYASPLRACHVIPPVFELYRSQSMPGPTLQKSKGTEGAAIGPSLLANNFTKKLMGNKHRILFAI